MLSFSNEVWALNAGTGDQQWESHDFHDIILQTALSIDLEILFIVGSANIAAMNAKILYDEPSILLI
jgi:outer membrane protein assembly factor BamB